MAKRAFGELESQILFILKSTKRKTVKEVHQILGGQDNYNTVMTVMSRLVEKKQLAREKMGLHYEYWLIPNVNASSLLVSLKKKLFGVTTSVLVNHLIETADDLSDDDLLEMEKLVQKAKDSRK